MPDPTTSPAVDARGLPPSYPLREEWEVTPRDVHALVERGEDVVILDVRTPKEFEVARLHLPTGNLATAGEPVDGPQVELVPLQQLMAQLPNLEELADRKVITLCHHGMRSFQAAAILRQAGFRDVYSMAGGIDAWSLAIDPSVPRY